MTAQSLIARDITDRAAVVRMAWLLVRMAGFLSLLLAGCVAVSFLFGAYLFSRDQFVIDQVQALVVPVRRNLLEMLFGWFMSLCFCHSLVCFDSFD